MGEFGPGNPELSSFIKEMEAFLPTIDDHHIKSIHAQELGEQDMSLWKSFIGLVKNDIDTIVSDIASFRKGIKALRTELEGYAPRTESAKHLRGLMRNDIGVLESECDLYDPDMPETMGFTMLRQKYHVE